MKNKKHITIFSAIAIIFSLLVFLQISFGPVPVEAQTQAVYFTHAAGTYLPGQAWTAVVSTNPALANQPITLCFTVAPTASGAAGTCASAESLGLPATTDGNGMWLATGTFAAADPNILGKWREYVKIGSFNSNSVEIIITPAYTTAASVTLTMTMPGGIIPPYGSQAEDTWILSATTNPVLANQPVSVCIARAPWILQVQGTCTPAGDLGLPANTDSAGKWTGTGTFPIDPNQAGGLADVDGRWSKYIKVGTVSSNTVDYSFVYSQLPRAVLTGDWGEKTIGTKYPGSSWWLNLATTPPMRGVIVYECYTKAPSAKGIEKDRCDAVESYGLPARTDSTGVWNGSGTFQDDPTAVGEWIVYMQVGNRTSNRVQYNFVSTGGVCTPVCTAGYQCVSGSCVPTTTTCTPACTTGQTCVNVQCVTSGCTPACTAGYQCVSGSCVPTTTTCTPACTTGQTCVNGQCITSGGGLGGDVDAYARAMIDVMTSLIAKYKAMLAHTLQVQSQGAFNAPSGSNTPAPAATSFPATITVNATLLNVRSAPNTGVGIITQLSKGSTFTATSVVRGENVEGTDDWWITSDGNYIWAGGTTY